MRRIKTYVMTVGVALSVAPIFNCALAQQGSNSTQLLLQVQTMRQEIAELRDMVERQQFQLRRLQKQAEAQSKQLGAVPGSDNRAPNYIAPPSDGSTVLQADGSVAQLGSATQVAGALPQANSGNPQIVANAGTDSNWDVPRTESANGAYRSDQPNQVSNQTVVSAANQNAYGTPVATQQGSQAGSYPPVVDRSFSTSAGAVPITGAGTRQPSVGGFQEAPSNQVSTESLANQARPSAFNTQDQGRDYQPQSAQTVAVPSPSGVISIPAQGSTQVGATGVGTVSAQSVIDASQIPAQASLPQANVSSSTQLATNQIPDTSVPAAVSQAPAPTVLAEDEYYAQGFELLKQSKYEEAASIFEQQLNAHPGGDLADDAHYWIAEAMHVSRKLDVAKTHLKAIISDYPQSRRLPDAMLKTAYIEQSQGNQMEARILFQEIVNLHPQSDAAIAAKNQLAAVN